MHSMNKHLDNERVIWDPVNIDDWDAYKGTSDMSVFESLRPIIEIDPPGETCETSEWPVV
jgi:hypothetical protein